ncbi:ribonuclease H-like protein [Neurospora crassa]|uniref:Oligoribonuclease n=1 Tax=Neurospora crassa (strain ATCC 24698 / 74-OR23-1A / CBS 708.71 / DSM 1257 / FGSC 987) TaxID=367110 RepID=V5IQX0_NEUCR|nr:oligoribonuclease [Neurospora crassa OR74A]ESA43994.1 oligoribonuclease [Neurospora crassa OR74A]KHE78433.1 ribonuclease H-like protein [Neurospora crassa]|eukprot:XP_011393370.1 oligoribonuclease [Neurospora crassa OR74A]
MVSTPKAAHVAAQQQSQGALVWIDCEMTGLDPDQDAIIEIYCFITDEQLNLLDPTGWGTVIHQTKARMDAMDEWCTQVHGNSGLMAAVLASTVTPEQAADGLLAYIQKYVPNKRVALLAGNSVHADRAFLRKEPYDRVVDHLHYRILDVSSLKEAARRWCPHIASGAPTKQGLHTAKEDILESIAEARYYRSAIFQKD